MPSSQQNVTNIPSNRVEIIDSRTGLVSREWYRFFSNLFNLAGAGGNQVSLDDLQVGPPPQPATASGGGGGSGTVTSVDMTVPTGLAVAGNPITTAGTLAVTYASGYAIPTTAKQTEWDTAYSDRLKWDGGATDLVAATGRTSLGATTVGGNFFTLTNPSAITFVQINADNTITTMDAPTFRTAIGAGTGGGSVTSVATSGTVNGLTLTGGPITTTGTVTLGGTLDLSSPPAIGGTTPAAGTFTTLGVTTSINASGAGSNIDLNVNSKGTGSVKFNTGTTSATQMQINDLAGANIYWAPSGGIGGTNRATLITAGNSTATSVQIGNHTAAPVILLTGSTEQFRIAHTASAVNYVQVTGAATGGQVSISAQGSDSAVGLTFNTKGVGTTRIQSNSISIARFTGTTSAVNYLDLTHSVTGQGPVISAQSISDSNTPLVLKALGTGAIDLAAGSRGVNISNGGTVTAITGTAAGTGYTSIPSVVITAPTTAGGVQATATAGMQFGGTTPTINSGGTGYTAGDTLTVVGGTGSAATIIVNTVSGGVITGASYSSGGTYTVIPTLPASVTGGTGSGATFSGTFAVRTTAYTITNAGSGYVEQPTVTFSGGGGSGAAAYATVGSDTTLKTLGTSLFLSHPNGVGLQVKDAGQVACYPLFQSSGTTIQTYASSVTASNVGYQWATKGVSGHSFATNNSVGNIQLNVSHTASAVNYVQVTGAATGQLVLLQTQGSDASVGMEHRLKGNPVGPGYRVSNNNGSNLCFAVTTSGTNVVNYMRADPAAAGVAAGMSAQGSDTNIDLALTPKGTGVVKTASTGIRFVGSSSGYVGLKGAAAAGSTTYTLPAADGTSGQVLSTDGAATLSWASAASSNVTAQGLWENSATISANYSVTSGNNALSSGPVSIASGVTVTVPSGSSWTIV